MKSAAWAAASVAIRGTSTAADGANAGWLAQVTSGSDTFLWHGSSGLSIYVDCPAP
jgi:hypothetical protein